MAATEYFKALVLDHAVNGTPYSIDNWSAALFISLPPASGDPIGEVSASEYTRLSITFDSNYQNTNSLLFPTALSTWGQVIYLAATDTNNKGQGKVLIYQSLGLGSIITAGNYIQVLAGALTLDLA